MISRLILFFLLFYLVVGKAVLKLKPGCFKLERRAGDNVPFECKVIFDNATSAAEKKVEKGPTWIFIDKAGVETVLGASGRRRVKSIDPYTLLLLVTNVTMDDCGSYRCTVKIFGEEEPIVGEASLKVYDGIHLLDFEEEQHPVEGESGRLEVKVAGDYKPQMHWYRIDKKQDGTEEEIIIETESLSDRYSFEDDGQVLVIENYTKALDDGNYKSSIYHVELGDMKEVVIHSEGYIAPNITEMKSGKFMEGQNVEFSCKVDGYPLPEIRWVKYLEDSPAYKTDKRGILEITEFSPEDDGTYSCEVENDAGTQRKNITTTDIYKKPRIEPMESQIIHRGIPTEIACIFTGNPELLARWSYNNTVIPTVTLGNSSSENVPRKHAILKSEEKGENKLILKIGPSQLDDSGEYECFVQNEAGNATQKVYLDIEHKPSVLADEVHIQPKAVQPVEIKCTAEAIPPVKWTWFKYYEPLKNNDTFQIITEPDGSVTKLKISMAYGNYGIYKCRAENVHGIDEKIFNVAPASN